MKYQQGFRRQAKPSGIFPLTKIYPGSFVIRGYFPITYFNFFNDFIFDNTQQTALSSLVQILLSYIESPNLSQPLKRGLFI